VVGERLAISVRLTTRREAREVAGDPQLPTQHVRLEEHDRVLVRAPDRNKEAPIQRQQLGGVGATAPRLAARDVARVRACMATQCLCQPAGATASQPTDIQEENRECFERSLEQLVAQDGGVVCEASSHGVPMEREVFP
jgi:hypothetical protein